MTQPKVLISDKMDPRAAQIFRERGIQVDEITGKTPDELKAIVGDYDGLAIRSSTKVTKDILGLRDQPEGRRPRRHRCRQCRHTGGDRARRGRHEHAVRQLDHDRRARHCSDVRAGPPASRSRRVDAGRQVGEEPLHGRRGNRQDAWPDRRGQHRFDRRQPRARPADEGRRLRPVPHARSGRSSWASRRSSWKTCSAAPTSSPCTRR